MAIGRAGRTGSIGAGGKKSGPVGRSKSRSGSSTLDGYDEQKSKVSYPTTTTSTTVTTSTTSSTTTTTTT